MKSNNSNLVSNFKFLKMTTTTTKKKLNRADYMFSNKTGEELIKKPGDVNGLDFAIRDLKDCQVYLMDHTA